MTCGLDKVKHRQDLMKNILILLLGIFIGVCVSNRRNEDTRTNVINNIPIVSVLNGSAQSIYHILPDFNEQEYIYQSTFRNCLGPACFNENVKLMDGRTAPRVGILGLRKSGGPALLNVIRKVTGPEFKTIDLVHDNHVPPYGYGKNHGWSSIVRISRRIVQHSYALTQPQLLDIDEASLSLKLMDLQVCYFSIPLIYIFVANFDWHC